MKILFEAWTDGDAVTFATAQGIKEQKKQGLIAMDAELLHSVEAETFDEAMVVHHCKMGFEPYKPIEE